MRTFATALDDEIRKLSCWELKKQAAYRKERQLQSTNLKSLAYDPQALKLKVTFHDSGTYEYAKVPASVPRNIVRAKSAGKAFHRLVRGKYTYEKLGEERPVSTFISAFGDELGRLGAQDDGEGMAKQAMQRSTWSTVERPSQARALRNPPVLKIGPVREEFWDDPEDLDADAREVKATTPSPSLSTRAAQPAVKKVFNITISNPKGGMFKFGADDPNKRSKKKRAAHAAAAGLATIAANSGATIGLLPYMGRTAKSDADLLEMSLKTIRDAQSTAEGMGFSEKNPMGGFHLFNNDSVADRLRTGALHDMIQVAPGAHESMIAHEIGHVKNYRALTGLSPALSPARDAAVIAGKLVSHLSPITAGIAAFQEKPSYVPSGIAAAVAAPLLLEEGAANIRALSYMVKKHGLGRGLLKSGPLGLSMLTYLTAGLSPLLVTAIRKARAKAQAEKLEATPVEANTEEAEPIQKAAWVDRIKGGLADTKKPSDFPPKALKQGLKVESEHTSNPHMAKEIAMDHLTEKHDYYKRLRAMEKK